MKTVSLLSQARTLILIGGCLAGATGGWADSFTLTPASPTLGIIPATPGSILWDAPGAVPGPPPPPFFGVPFPALGLLAGDVVDAISDGFDPVTLPHLHFFSVTPGSAGALGSGVAAEVAGDTPPGVTPGHASDIFLAGTFVPPGTNILAPPGFGWTLGTTSGDEANTNLINPGDNVNSYDLATIAPAAATPIFFSLAAGSPSLGAFSAADIFVSAGAGAFFLYLPGAAIGLPVGADIDALALETTGGPGFGFVSLEYSLTAATAGLVPAALGSGATILTMAGGVPVTAHTPASIGLLAGDDLDALDVVPEPSTCALLALGGLLAARRRRRA